MWIRYGASAATKAALSNVVKSPRNSNLFTLQRFSIVKNAMRPTTQIKAQFSSVDSNKFTIAELSDLETRLLRYQTYYEASEFDPHARNALQKHGSTDDDWIAKAYLGILHGLGHLGVPADKNTAAAIGTEVVPKLLTLLENERQQEKESLSNSPKSSTVAQLCYLLALYHELGWGVTQNGRLAIDFYLEAAYRQHKLAQHTLGELSRLGHYSKTSHSTHQTQNELSDVPKGRACEKARTPDHESAIHWYARAASQGHAPAQFQLAQLLYEQFLTRIFQEVTTGSISHTSTSVSMDGLSDIEQYYQDAAFQGHGPAQYQLASLYGQTHFPSSSSTNTIQNPLYNATEAFTWYQRAADQGFAAAQTMVGLCFAQGALNITPNEEQALFWLRKAAKEGGDSNANFHLGSYLLHLHQTRQQLQQQEKPETSAYLSEGIRCLRDAVTAHNDFHALISLTQLLRSSQVPQSELLPGEQSFGMYYWYDRIINEKKQQQQPSSPAATYPESLYQVAIAYQTPEIHLFATKYTTHTYEKYAQQQKWSSSPTPVLNEATYRFHTAHTMLQQAAKLGHVGAQGRLGGCLYHGQYGITQDIAASIPWLSAASQQGDPASMTLLGLAYLLGQGGIDANDPEVEKKGKEWIYQAAEMKYPLAMELVDEANAMKDDDT